MRCWCSSNQMECVVGNLLCDCESTCSAMLTFLSNKNTETTIASTSDGWISEVFAREDEVVFHYIIKDENDHLAKTAVDYAFSCLSAHGFVGISISSIFPEEGGALLPYSSWLHHSFVLTVPSDFPETCASSCIVVDAFAGCMDTSRMWEWKNWRESLYLLLRSCVPGPTREDLWVRCFSIRDDKKKFVSDGTVKNGIEVKIKY